MEQTGNRRPSGQKKVVSRADAVLIMAVAAMAAAATTFMTVAGIIETFTGPVTLTLPLRLSHESPTGLGLDSVARFTAMEATIPALPSGEAVLLAWAGVLNQVSFLAVTALLFLLAFRLRGENLFTPASAGIVGASGVVLALAGTVGQALDAAARNRIAELIGANPQTPDGVIFAFGFNFVPLVSGVVLVLVAAVFQFGRHLQRDIEGLV
jgi:hypothetical protein